MQVFYCPFSAYPTLPYSLLLPLYLTWVHLGELAQIIRLAVQIPQALHIPLKGLARVTLLAAAAVEELGEHRCCACCTTGVGGFGSPVEVLRRGRERRGSALELALVGALVATRGQQ